MDSLFAELGDCDDLEGVDTDSDEDVDTAPTLASVMKLNDGNVMPILGLGVYMAAPGDETYRAVKWALDLGYRLVDTASMYDNEEAVGRAMRDSGIPREELFVTSKLNTPDHGFSSTIQACKASLARLNMDYVDLYLIHSPFGGKLIETFDGLQKLKADGLIKSFGVSNFGIKHLKALRRHGRPFPAVNQIEMHPMIYRKRQALQEYCKENKIVITAYGSMFSGKQSALKSTTLLKIAQQQERTPNQILLRWSHQHGFAIIPKSVSAKERQAENSQIFDFELNEVEMEALSNMGGKLGEYWNPVVDAPVNLGSIVSLSAR
jgi:diketogulonate reductase-like aldo/keto reductase